MAEFELRSQSFQHGEPIPDRHTLDADNLSPTLSWSGTPEGTGSLALVCDDPDAPSGTFVHWVAWGIGPGTDGLGEGESAPAEGTNGFGDAGYGGPRPPEGHGPHRYFFRLYALDGELDLPDGAGREELERAMEGRVLGTAELMGTYER